MESNHLLMLFRHPREPSTPEFQNFAGQEGFEPSTIRLTAERTTAVLLTLKKNPQHGGLFGVNYLQALYSIIRSIQDSFMQSQH